MGAIRSVVLLSGGMDSTACAIAAVREHGRENVRALLVGYGQPHRNAELAAAQRLCGQIGIDWRGIETADAFPRPDHMAIAPHTTAGAHPATVPGRNLVLLALAAAHACAWWPDGRIEVWIGACADDAAGFVDCPHATIALTAMTGRLVSVRAPLLRTSKRDLVANADPMLLDALLASWSCYRGTACGECTPCVLRADAFAGVGILDDQRAAPMCGGDPHREARP